MTRVSCVLIALCLTAPGFAAAAEPPPPIQREIIPGSELMTSHERERYRQRMRGAKSAEAQAAVREGHVKQMRERARLRGLALPEPQQNAR
jgi:hypothetical protein